MLLQFVRAGIQRAVVGGHGAGECGLRFYDIGLDQIIPDFRRPFAAFHREFHFAGTRSGIIGGQRLRCAFTGITPRLEFGIAEYQQSDNHGHDDHNRHDTNDLLVTTLLVRFAQLAP